MGLDPPIPIPDLSGKVAIVTGGHTGLYVIDIATTHLTIVFFR